MWLKKYKSNGAIINKIKMLKTFNCLGLHILALGYSSHIFLKDSENFKLIKHLKHFTLNFTEMRPIKKIILTSNVRFFN